MKKLSNFFQSIALISAVFLASCVNNVINEEKINIKKISILGPENFDGIIEIGKFNESGLKFDILYENGTESFVCFNENFIPQTYKHLLSEPGVHTIDILFRGVETSYTFEMAYFYNVNFYVEGNLVYTNRIPNGRTATFDGDNPTKEGDAQYVYKFSGWDKDLTNVQCDIDTYALFDCNLHNYTVTWVDYDGSILEVDQKVPYGTIPEYNGTTPTRANEDDTIFTFIGWDNQISEVTGDVIYAAQYSEKTEFGCRVIFLDNDGAELYRCYVQEGEDAIYLGEVPWKFDDQNVYTFKSWSHSLKNVTSNLTVSAEYIRLTREQNGEYPQSVVSDEALISSLNALTKTNAKGYYEYGGEQYEKVCAKPFLSNYTFNNGAIIQSDTYYYFKVEPIQWKYLSDDGATALLTSEYLLDAHRYNENYSGQNDQGYYANNYKNSEIRNWLNNDFFDKAFDDDSMIVTTHLDNSVASTGESSNQYVCETTYDKIFLLSYKEITNSDYGFAANADRCCKTIEYARARGAYMYTSEDYCRYGYGFYWTRSPGSIGSDRIWDVYSDGNLNISYVYLNRSGVRPSLSLNIA